MARAENRYRKIEIRMWADQKFRKLSPMPPSGQSLWFYLLSGPHTGIIPGLSKARRVTIADELAWTPEDFDAAFKEIASQQMAEADWQAGVVWIPNAIKCNPPQSPNVITAWRKEWPLIPECDLKTKALEAMRLAVSELVQNHQAYCLRFNSEFAKPSGKPSAKPSRKPSAKTMSNQEQFLISQEWTQKKRQYQRRPLPILLSLTGFLPKRGTVLWRCASGYVHR
jgi:hypothetical protein